MPRRKLRYNMETPSRYPSPQIAPTPTMPTAAIRKLRPCGRDFGYVTRQYPTAIPLLPETIDLFVSQGVDVLWAGLQLLTNEERVGLILWSLRYRQPHVATLLRSSAMHAEADTFAALRFETVEDAAAALPILEGIRAATWAATWAATRDATWAATWAATRAATWAATWAATRDATRDATRAEMQREVSRRVLAILAGREVTL